MEKQQHSRRAALGALASAPALAILPAVAVAVAVAFASTARLSTLIEAHDAAQAICNEAPVAVEAAEPDPGISVPYLGRERPAIGNRDRKRLIEDMELMFQFELHKLETISKLSPEVGLAARATLETERAAYIAQLDEVFAGYVGARAAFDDAINAEEVALTALCTHRCVSTKEVGIKLRYLMNGPVKDELQSEQIDALLASFLPEGEEIEAFV